MRRYLAGCAAIAIIATSSFAAHAADPADVDMRIDQAFSGELSAWVQGILTTNREDLSAGSSVAAECEPNTLSDLCGETLGVGIYAALFAPVGDFTIIGDLTIDIHGTTNSDEPDDNLSGHYGAVGLHTLYGQGPTQYGGFGVFGAGTTLDQSPQSDEDGALFAGGGLQVVHNNYFVQAGAVFGLFPDSEVNLDNLFFVRAGGAFEVGPGVFEASGAFGFGDFDGDDGDPPQRDDSYWVQATAEYSAPLVDKIDWFARYQGDFLQTSDSNGSRERVLIHTVALGITVPFGGGRAPVSTPNFRAPIVAADELN
ncbi:MAG: hypothetical protein AAF940_09750 [Pseudomonadota bacterium]